MYEQNVWMYYKNTAGSLPSHNSPATIATNAAETQVKALIRKLVNPIVK